MPRYYTRINEREIGFALEHTEEGACMKVILPEEEEGEHSVDLAPVYSSPITGEGLYSLLVDAKSYQLYVSPREGGGFQILESHHRIPLEVLTEREWRLQKLAPKEVVHAGRTSVTAPMPGLVKRVLVQKGSRVKEGDRLVVLEAMKMENEITSNRAGEVTAVHVSAGSVVEGGRALLTIE